MKIFFWAIGKPHESLVKQGVEEFSKRIQFYYKLDWEIIPGIKEASTLDPSALKKREAELVLTRVQKNDYLVALDERGTQISSVGLAEFIQKQANSGTRRLIFLIGGAYGLDESVLKVAHFTWSLSLLVFPHQLVRLLLAEQVYRACTIQKNEKYHH